MKLFKYSGGKSKLVKKYTPPPKGTERIIEPFAGSMSYSLEHVLKSNVYALGIESNQDVVHMWNWLKQCTPNDLRDLLSDFLKFSKPEGFDVRDMKLSPGPETYVRLCTTGVVTGQLFAWKVYSQHKLPVESTIECLPSLKNIQVVHGNGTNFPGDADSLWSEKSGDLVFIDPPYTGTKAGYFEKSSKKNHELGNLDVRVDELITYLQSPVIFTYGNEARETFPNYDWINVAERKVPKIRSGGCSIRKEHVAYIRMLRCYCTTNFFYSD